MRNSLFSIALFFLCSCSNGEYDLEFFYKSTNSFYVNERLDFLRGYAFFKRVDGEIFVGDITHLTISEDKLKILMKETMIYQMDIASVMIATESFCGRDKSPSTILDIMEKVFSESWGVSKDRVDFALNKIMNHSFEYKISEDVQKNKKSFCFAFFYRNSMMAGSLKSFSENYSIKKDEIIKGIIFYLYDVEKILSDNYFDVLKEDIFERLDYELPD